VIKVFAIVKEHERRLFVTTLTQLEVNDLGDFGVEHLVAEWCAKKQLTFVDFAL
jgi:hypothetical protein